MEKPFNIEVNGPANIIMQIDVWLALGKVASAAERERLALLRQDAVETVKYMKLLADGHRPPWHELNNYP